MMGASTEAALDLWASSLRDDKVRMGPLFTQERVAASAGLFLDGLLGPEPPHRAVCAMRAGCGPRLRATRDRGASRPSWAVAGGVPMPCAMRCVPTITVVIS